MSEVHGEETPDEETLAFEAEVVRRVTASLASGLDELVAAILAAFEGARAKAGGTLSDAQARALGEGLARRLEGLRAPKLDEALVRVAAEARDLGVRRAARRFRGEEKKRAERADWRKRTKGRVSVPRSDRAVRDGLAEAATIARSGIKTRRDAAAVAGKVRATKAKVQGHARLVANEGINAGTAEVARAMRLRLLWVTERNGCLHCLAHAGYAVDPGKQFPALSFDPSAKGIPTVEFPPLHPNCRCQVRTFDGPAGAPDKNRSAIDPAARLAAEARRSVVYQWTDHASGAAAQRAAAALLSAGAGLPASVEKRARTALRKGGVGRPR